MHSKLNINKFYFLQIFKKFVFFYKKVQALKNISVALNILVLINFNVNLNWKRNNFLFLIDYFKLFFNNFLNTKFLRGNYFNSAISLSLFNFNWVFNFSTNIRKFFKYLFYIYLHFFYVLQILSNLKNKVNAFFFSNKTKASFFIYKKFYSKILIYTTFNSLLRKFYALLKLRVITYKKRLMNVLNCYIKFTRHNIFITIASSLNVPLVICSSGKAGYGGKTKFKVSSQAAARSASLISKLLTKKKLIKNLVVFIVSNRLFDKRIKSILTVFAQKGFKISYIVPQLLRSVGGVRQKKIRRV